MPSIVCFGSRSFLSPKFFRRPNCAFCDLKANSATDKTLICRGTRNIAIFLWSSLLFWIPRSNCKKTLYCSKSLRKQATLRNPLQNVWDPEPVFGIHEQKFYNCLVNLSCRGIRNCMWNPQTLSRIRINFRNPLTFAESGTNICLRSLLNPQQINVPTKVTLEIFVRGIH